MALQKLGDVDMDKLLEAMTVWQRGNLLEKRASAAALCEPRLLKTSSYVQKVLDLLDQMMEDILQEKDRRKEDFRVLRKAMGYCWSVAAAAEPVMGKQRMEKWLLWDDPDIRWIMKENLKKNRLIRLDPDWTEGWRQKLCPKKEVVL